MIESPVVDIPVAVEKREHRVSNLNLIDLFQASQEELETFSELVAQRGNKVQILVHPYFSNSVGEEYKKLRDQFIASCIGNNVPLVIFEEEGKFKKLKRQTLKFFRDSICS